MEELEFNEIAPDVDKQIKKKRIVVSVVCVLLVVILAVATGLLLKQYVFASFIVDGTSMYPTLDGGNGDKFDNQRTNGEVLYLDKVAKISRGDIVVFNTEKAHENTVSTLVKRVIAVGGDHLQIKDCVVYVNDRQLDEPYITPMTKGQDIDIYIPDGKIFCMGDNRDVSLDSRVFGPVSLDDVVGKCFLIKGLDGKLRKPQ